VQEVGDDLVDQKPEEAYFEDVLRATGDEPDFSASSAGLQYEMVSEDSHVDLHQIFTDFKNSFTDWCRHGSGHYGHGHIAFRRAMATNGHSTFCTLYFSHKLQYLQYSLRIMFYVGIVIYLSRKPL